MHDTLFTMLFLGATHFLQLDCFWIRFAYNILFDCFVSLHIDVPVFPTVTAIVTLERFQAQQTSAERFLVPRNYKKFDVRLQLLILTVLFVCILYSTWV